MTLSTQAHQPTTHLPVTVMVSFIILPGREDMWLDGWREIACLAARRPACHRSRLLRARNDTGRCAMVSEWDSLADFDRFAREAGLVWIDRVATYSRAAPQITVFELVHEGAGEPALALA